MLCMVNVILGLQLGHMFLLILGDCLRFISNQLAWHVVCSWLITRVDSCMNVPEVGFDLFLVHPYNWLAT